MGAGASAVLAAAGTLDEAGAGVASAGADSAGGVWLPPHATKVPTPSAQHTANPSFDMDPE